MIVKIISCSNWTSLIGGVDEVAYGDLLDDKEGFDNLYSDIQVGDMVTFDKLTKNMKYRVMKVYRGEKYNMIIFDCDAYICNDNGDTIERVRGYD